VIGASTVDSFLQTVKMDHVVWKLDVYKVMLGTCTKSSSEFADHTMCRLGKWYYEGEGTEKYSANHSFKRLAEPHRIVHAAGVAAMESFQQGDMTSAIKSLAMMEKASLEVIELLTGLSHDISSVNKANTQESIDLF